MLSIRLAKPKDAALLATMIHELAEYDRLGNEAIVTAEDVTQDGFGRKRRFRALIAEWDGQPAGYSVFFEVYSTFQGLPGLFMDDIFVRPEYRKKGIGKALLGRVAKFAWDEGYFCVRWEVLHWNTDAITFFEKQDAFFMDDWKAGLLVGDALEAAAKQAG